nr:MAG TPA: hypothetical protein [Caudoviricetes sp.]
MIKMYKKVKSLFLFEWLYFYVFFCLTCQRRRCYHNNK